MSELKPIIEESFKQYAGAVIQSRALVDSRDCLKPSARQIFYCLYTDKFIHSKPFNKTLKAIGSAFRMYIHGDSSAEGIIMRAGQPFAMRYPLVDVEGSFGNIQESGNWSAPRYTGARLSELSNYLFNNIDKDTITNWRDNYDDTEQYPTILPSMGFYNLVNGTSGIGVGLASSIPQFNITELNNALIHLLWNPDASFDELYCAPDFATGGLLLNESEVKESLKKGTGKACKLRAVVEYDNAERCFTITEIPYSVYTNTICEQLEKIIESDENPGIDRFNDLSKQTPNFKIYLTKTARPNKVLTYLYKNTSLQYHYGINMTMLENGHYPKVFSWKETLQSHINHEIEVYTRAFQFDLNKIKARLHIIEGLLKAIDMIDEVIKTIKGSESTQTANIALQKLLSIDHEQAKAILDIKLSKLAHLEVNKLITEQSNLIAEQSRIENILSHDELLKKEIESGLRMVAQKFGDARRTKILNTEKDDDDVIEEKSLLLQLTNQNNLIATESSTLYVQRRGSVGSKFKLGSNEYIISACAARSLDNILFFTQNGMSYQRSAAELEINEKISLDTLLNLGINDKICAMTSFNKNRGAQNTIIITEQGILKKSLLSEYNSNRRAALKAIDLAANDKIISILFLQDEPIGILTRQGNLMICNTKDIRAIGRTAKGIKGITLSSGDVVVAAQVINKPSTYLFVSKKGYTKRINHTEVSITSRATKGVKIQKLNSDDEMVGFLPLTTENEVIFVTSAARLKIKVDDINILGRTAMGVQSAKLVAGTHVVGLTT